MYNDDMGIGGSFDSASGNTASGGRLNCWEYMKCGKVTSGSRGTATEICPVGQSSQLNGVHGGVGAGRACWVIPGTLCGDELQGTYAQKYRKCSSCRFYAYVAAQEGEYLISPATLLALLKS